MGGGGVKKETRSVMLYGACLLFDLYDPGVL